MGATANISHLAQKGGTANHAAGPASPTVAPLAERAAGTMGWLDVMPALAIAGTAAAALAAATGFMRPELPGANTGWAAAFTTTGGATGPATSGGGQKAAAKADVAATCEGTAGRTTGAAFSGEMLFFVVGLGGVGVGRAPSWAEPAGRCGVGLGPLS
jgi:hypothetical protein